MRNSAFTILVTCSERNSWGNKAHFHQIRFTVQNSQAAKTISKLIQFSLAADKMMKAKSLDYGWLHGELDVVS